ncbi:hypothetical protein B0T19DRAFT_152755 [Cercophora scortea]|uniref:Uncharacterized protein n=1 Tax=Cercophora scortea TaxID=314031 RepID=A0AAE0MCG5_9PEZI|nr:hypothetical protein B0T19DRAFT_152755 [Cercophora scortea]
MKTYETCGRFRRKSSRSSGRNHRNRRGHHRSHRRFRRSHHRRSCHQPWCSCGQCGRPHRTERGNVSNDQTKSGWLLTCLVALSTGLAAAGLATGGGAVAGDMARLAAPVAGLVVLGALGAVTAHVTLTAAVVAVTIMSALILHGHEM